ncbi:hypothetical protein PT276_01775 [Orbaceae bacterium ESL0721]|nr:hypothetical protein [Orbaceae bacterium ESL0721]
MDGISSAFTASSTDGANNSCFELFGIIRSLSNQSCLYDNAVSGATFMTIKTEFVKNTTIKIIQVLQKRFSACAYCIQL